MDHQSFVKECILAYRTCAKNHRDLSVFKPPLLNFANAITIKFLKVRSYVKQALWFSSFEVTYFGDVEREKWKKVHALLKIL
jgi:hypothetical protein